MDKEQVIKSLELAVAKSEAADYKVKYDVLYTAVKRVIRESRPLPPIEDWRNGHYEMQAMMAG